MKGTTDIAFASPVISLLVGVVFSPKAINLIRPIDYTHGNEEALASVTLNFTRLVLGVQLVIAGVQLPSKYLRREWRSLAYLLGPGMVCMWLCTGLLVWAFVPNLSFLSSLAIGACVTPTDPVLSNTIVKGKFAERNVPRELRNIIVAESGTNDGLGYPFLFLPLFLVRYMNSPAENSAAVGMAFSRWLYETWMYQVVFGVAYGAVVGLAAKKLLRWAEAKRYVDRESFIVFVIALAVSVPRRPNSQPLVLKLVSSSSSELWGWWEAMTFLRASSPVTRSPGSMSPTFAPSSA